MTARSGNEIAAMVLRAARGAGVPLAMAEDLAAATGWAEGDLGAFSDALTTDAPPAQFEGLTVTGLRAAYDGPLAIDLALAYPGKRITINGVDEPRVLRALVRSAAQLNGLPFRLDQRVLVAGEGPATPPPSLRADVDDTIWERLARLAAKTYVPDSEASRLSGAGAGLSDND